MQRIQSFIGREVQSSYSATQTDWKASYLKENIQMQMAKQHQV